MQKRISKSVSLFFIILCLSISLPTFGQVETKQPLVELMQQLEKEYNVRFSYIPDDLVGIMVTIPPNAKKLQLILKLLNEQTQLKFRLFKDRYITVVKTKNNSYCGQIIALDTGMPLEGATILLPGKSASTLSDVHGFFYIDGKVSPQSQLTISYLGYFPVKLNLKDFKKDCLTITLHPQSVQLAEVLIRIYLVKGVSKQSDGALQLNIAEFGLLPGQVENDVLQIVQALPGVESVNETISSINIRGGADFETLMLWDGIKIYQNGHFFGLISAFDANLTKQVNIYKNGTPSRYGESLSGVIAMQSENEVSHQFSGGGGVNLINGNAFARIPLSENASLQVSGRHSLSFLNTPVYDNYSERMFQNTKITSLKTPDNETEIATNVGFSFYDFNSKLLWDITKNDKLRINFMTIDNYLSFTESLENSATETSNLQQGSMVGGISWQHIWNPHIQTTAMAYGTYYLLNARNRNLFTTQEQYQENEVLETGIKLDSRFLVSDKLSLNAGYQFVETGVANVQDVNLPRFRDYKKEVLRTHSLYSTLKYTPNDYKTTLHIGLRSTLFNKFDQPSFEPRVNLQHKLGKGYSVELSGEMKYQSITQRIDYESDFLGIKKRRWTLANNTNIPLMKSKQVSIGFNYDKDGWYMGLEGFYKKVIGITAISQAFQNQFQFVDATGNYTSDGMEFVINKKTTHLSAWFSYLFMQNNYQFASFTPSKFPNNIDIRHSATLAGTYSLKNLKLSMGFNWHSGKPYTIPDAINETVEVNGQDVINFAKPNAERIPDYFRADFSAEYLWAISPNVKAKINVGVLNFLDTKNTLNIHYTLSSNTEGESQINRIEDRSLGLTPNVSLQLLF